MFEPTFYCIVLPHCYHTMDNRIFNFLVLLSDVNDFLFWRFLPKGQTRTKTRQQLRYIYVWFFACYYNKVELIGAWVSVIFKGEEFDPKSVNKLQILDDRTPWFEGKNNL